MLLCCVFKEKKHSYFNVLKNDPALWLMLVVSSSLSPKNRTYIYIYLKIVIGEFAFVMLSLIFAI